jgi:hypothetical protein
MKLRKRVLAFGLSFPLFNSVFLCAFLLCGCTQQEPSIFRLTNLVAWAVVPFDNQFRDATQRAQMLKRLGFTKFAYDWRQQHIPAFASEIVALRSAGIEYVAFWGIHEQALSLFQKHAIRPQFWWFSQSPEGNTHKERVANAAAALLPQLDRAASIGSDVGLYNHLGWGGEPANMVAIVERLRTVHQRKNIGIVYNFHHGHTHIKDFSAHMALMKPYLLCVNLNGMNDKPEPKILTIGEGKHERRMIEIVRQSGYRGPIGIIAHQETKDAEVVLRANLDGLKRILQEQGDTDALASYPTP